MSSVQAHTDQMQTDLIAIATQRTKKELQEAVKKMEDRVHGMEMQVKSLKKSNLPDSKKKEIKKSSEQNIKESTLLLNELKRRLEHLKDVDESDIVDADITELRKLNNDLLVDLTSELKMQYVTHMITVLKSDYPAVDKAELMTGLLGMLAAIKEEREQWSLKRDIGLVSGEYVVPESYHIGRDEENDLEFEFIESDTEKIDL